MPKKRVISAAVIVVRTADNGIEVLLQLKRKFQQWEFPGGKLDGIERVRKCAKRELYEETGIIAEELEFVTYVDHSGYCCLMFIATKWSGFACVMEPDKHSIVGWFPLQNLPDSLTKAAKASVKVGALRPLYNKAGVNIADVEEKYAD